MTTDRNGGPAFPVIPPQDEHGIGSASGYPFPDEGMSLRQWYAGQALPVLLRAWIDDGCRPSARVGGGAPAEELACRAFDAADAMLAAGGRHPGQDALDTAWAQINAIGGTAEPGDEAGAAVNRTVDQALAIIEALGGRDPLKRRIA